MPKTKFTIGVDLGGTKILVAVVDDKGKVISTAKKTTHADKGPKEVIARILQTMDEAVATAKLSKRDIAGIGLGAPGVVDNQRGMVLSAPNLPGFKNIELAAQLKAWQDCNVALSNDVRVAAIGEHRQGAGRGVHDLIAIFVGTGIGGGIIINDKVLVGQRFSAGEIGHIITLADGPYQGDAAIRGSIEALASRTAIERDLRAGLLAGRKSVLPELMVEKGGAVTSSVLAKAVAKNDPLTIQVMQRAAYLLGLHAASLINSFDPEMLIYGGGVVEGLGKWILPQITEVAKQNCINRADLDKVRIVEAELGEQAGVIGAALMAREGI